MAQDNTNQGQVDTSPFYEFSQKQTIGVKPITPQMIYGSPISQTQIMDKAVKEGDG